MPIYFVYHQPHDMNGPIKGCYIVEISCDLPSDVEEIVSVGRIRSHHCGSCGKQTPVFANVRPAKDDDEEDQKKEVMYRIPNIIIGDEIVIEIHKKEIEPYQHATFKANKMSFTFTEHPFTMNNHRFGVIQFSKIMITDRDGYSTETDDSNSELVDITY